jgi:hypothetical protein
VRNAVAGEVGGALDALDAVLRAQRDHDVRDRAPRRA